MPAATVSQTSEHGSTQKAGVINARLDHRDPLVFDTRELGRRPGAMKKVSRTVPAPEEFGLAELIGVPPGSSIELELRLESVMEGVLVTGTAHAPLEGECVRCLEPIEREFDTDFQEMYSYPDAGERYGGESAGSDEGDEEETLFVEDDLFDLEPVLRDAVVLALPLQPVCRTDCPGLCSDCGARLADDPEHHHGAADIRWAALQGLAESLKAGEKDDTRGADPGADEEQEK